MKPEEAREQTRKHIKRVGELLKHFSHVLLNRAQVHDASKLEEPEASIFEANTAKLSGLTYGSDEYNAALANMKVAIDHHYERNAHHPECHKHGVDDMDLLDLVEMFADWRGACERHADGDIRKSIEHNTERFNLSPQLVRIFQNSVALFER